ncbi:hypothetical protein [Prosthecobacter sp.]|uniref:hypothetical protein n=1 Tax=Prosthecobacter sp. TaxID=1965333 RepID=UPI003783DB39
MRKLRPSSSESLDLLLDTLCNMFGGIILISCLLALLTHNNTPTPGDPTEITGTQGRLLAERLDAAKKELAGIQQLSKKMKDTGQDKLQALLQERDELRATQERLRQLQASQMNANDASTKDPVGDIKELRAEVKALDMRDADAKARKEAAQQKGRDLAAKIQSIRSQITDNNAKQTEHVRFPKEREITKTPMNVLLKYGAIYPLVDASGENFPGITRVEKADEAFEAIPKKSEGIAMTDTAAVRRLLASFQRWGGYVSLNVYPDSYDTFRALKELILEAGLDYGFDVIPEHFIITFSPKGTSPKPL